MQFLGTIKKLASLVPEATKCKVVENTHNFGRHRTKIGPNPTFWHVSRTREQGKIYTQGFMD